MPGLYIGHIPEHELMHIALSKITVKLLTPSHSYSACRCVSVIKGLVFLSARRTFVLSKLHYLGNEERSP